METRYFILTPGRSGSSLLCAIMADAGADFGMAAPKDWDRTWGALEHPLIMEAAKQHNVAMAAHETAPLAGLAKLDWKRRRSRAKKLVSEVLKRAEYVKAGGLDRLSGAALRLGYDVRPIISLRSFDTLCASMLRWPGYFRSFRGIEKVYVETYENALSLLYARGGTYVDYDEVTDPAQSAWADRLAAATGLEATALLRARGARVSGKAERKSFPIASDRAEAVYRAIVEVAGEAGAAQAVRQ